MDINAIDQTIISIVKNLKDAVEIIDLFKNKKFNKKFRAFKLVSVIKRKLIE